MGGGDDAGALSARSKRRRGPYPEIDQLDLWTQAVLSGCAFAQRAATNGAISWWADRNIESISPALFEGVIDDAAKGNAIAGLVVRRASSAPEIASLLAQLATSERWQLKRLSTGIEPAGCTSVELNYRTTGGLKASVMGLAPLPSMPVTRRAPYTTLMVWAGARGAGVYKRSLSAEGEVGLTDAPLDRETPNCLDREVRDVHAQRSKKTRDLLDDPADDVLRRVWRMTFCLPAELLAALGA